MAEIFNKIVKSLTEPTDTRCVWVKGNNLYVFINGGWKCRSDSIEDLPGIYIKGKTAKDLLGCDSNFLHLGTTDDTTSYTNITPLNENGKVPTTYIDKLDSTVQVVYNDTKYEINMDKAVELGLFSKSIEFVDLGLSSGTKWMKCNIGAEKETDYRLFFQWGATVGYDESTVAAHSTWVTCPGNGGASSYDPSALTAWDAANLTNDVLNTSVDAAYAYTNGKAKMPTSTQLNELVRETNNEWVTIDGIAGKKFTNKTDSSKYIFIPAAGFIDGEGHWTTGKRGYIFGSYRDSGMMDWGDVSFMSFDMLSPSVTLTDRVCSRSVRGVLNQ